MTEDLHIGWAHAGDSVEYHELIGIVVLDEYNFNRPHQSFGYLTLVEYIEKEPAKIRSPVSPMWSASTRP